MSDRSLHYRTCPLCEATCGLEVTVEGDATDGTVVRIRGECDDVFSHGFICPKGSTLKQLHENPDRLRSPLVKRDGRHVNTRLNLAAGRPGVNSNVLTDGSVIDPLSGNGVLNGIPVEVTPTPSSEAATNTASQRESETV